MARIGCDIDGVLADFQPLFTTRIVDVTGRDLYPKADYDTRYPCWDHPQFWGYTDAEMSKVWKTIVNEPMFWGWLDHYPDTFKSCGALENREKDDLYFVTDRPGVGAKDQTEHWLYRFGINNPTVIISKHKGLVARALSLDYYIDDRWENALDVATTSARSFLLDRPWNRNLGAGGYAEAQGITRVTSVMEFLSCIPATKSLQVA